MTRSGKTILAWFTGLLTAGFLAFLFSPVMTVDFTKNGMGKKINKIRYPLKKSKVVKREVDRETPDCFI